MKRQTNLSEMVAAFYAITSGLWIIAFDVLHSATFTVRALYGAEEAWGAVPIVAGLLLAAGSLRRWHRVRVASLSMLVVFFVFTTVVFLLTEFRVAAFPAYFSSVLAYALLLITEIQREWIRDGKVTGGQ